MVIVEAAAVGIPAIGTRISGISDAIKDGETGLLVEAGDVSTLQDAMLKLTDDAVLRRRLGLSAHKNVVENFKNTEVVEGYIKMFRSVLS